MALIFNDNNNVMWGFGRWQRRVYIKHHAWRRDLNMVVRMKSNDTTTLWVSDGVPLSALVQGF